VFAAVTVVAVLTMISGRIWWSPVVRPATITATVGFVAAAVGAGALRSRYGRLMLVGLVLCAVGDLVGPHNFYYGMYAFLAAHLAFVPAFLTRARGAPAGRKQVRIAALLVGGATVVLILWLYPYLPGIQRVGIVLYALVIGAFVIAAFAVRLRSLGAQAAAVGAVVFYISDIFVANWEFVVTDSWNAFVAYPLYYSACLLLAASVFERSPPAS